MMVTSPQHTGGTLQNLSSLADKGYVFTASPYDPQGWPEIFAVVVISFVIFLVPFSTLLVVRLCQARHHHNLHHLPTTMNGGNGAGPTVPIGTLVRGGCSYLASMFVRMIYAAISPASFVLEDLRCHGAEAASLLYVEREFARFFLFLSVFTNTILIPLHMTNRGIISAVSSSSTSSAREESEAINRDVVTTTTTITTSGRRNSASDFAQMTIQNLPENGGTLVLWIHVGFFYFITVFVLVQMRRLARNLLIIEALARRARPEFSWNSSLFVRGPPVPSIPHMTQAELWDGLRFIFPTPGDVTNISMFENLNASSSAKRSKWWNSIVTLRAPSLARRFQLDYAEMAKESLRDLTRRGIEEAGEEGGSPSGRAEEIKEDIKRLARLGVERWEVERAPDPQDVIWESLRINTRLYYVKTLGVNVLIGVVLVMFTTPLALISFVSGATSPQMRDELSDTYTVFVMRLRAISPWFADFLFNFIPQLALVVADAWLLFAFQITSKSLEPHAAYTSREVTVFRKSFAFLLFNTFILPCFALSTVGAFVGSVLRNDSSPLEFLGRVFVTNSGAFTLCFVATQTWVGAAMDISRLSERTVAWIRSRLASRPHPALAKFEIDYASEHAVVLTVFSLCIVFATVAPPITLFGVSYFLVKSAMDKYSLESVVAEREIDQIPRAAVGRSLVRSIYVPLLCFQMAVCGFFLSNVCREEEEEEGDEETVAVVRLENNNNNSTMIPTSSGRNGGGNNYLKPCVDAEGFMGVIQSRGSELQLAVLFLGFIVTCGVIILDLVAGRTKLGMRMMRRIGLGVGGGGESEGAATEEETAGTPSEAEIHAFVEEGTSSSLSMHVNGNVPRGSPRASSSSSSFSATVPRTPLYATSSGAASARHYSSSVSSSSSSSLFGINSPTSSVGAGAGVAMGRLTTNGEDVGRSPSYGKMTTLSMEEEITPVIGEEEVMRLIGSR